MLKSYYINNSNPQLEAELLVLWAKFCFKSPPLPIFEGKKTVSQKFSAIHRYFEDNFRGNLCFYVEEKGFAVFGEGQKWLDNEIPELADKKVAALIMGISLNNSLADARNSLEILRESFKILKEDCGYDVVAWNQNRMFKEKGFSRLMKMLGAKQIEDCFFV